jgi:hypothetical protein
MRIHSLVSGDRVQTPASIECVDRIASDIASFAVAHGCSAKATAELLAMCVRAGKTKGRLQPDPQWRL